MTSSITPARAGSGVLAVALVVTVAVGATLFREPVGWQNRTGVGLIVAGVLLVATRG